MDTNKDMDFIHKIEVSETIQYGHIAYSEVFRYRCFPQYFIKGFIKSSSSLIFLNLESWLHHIGPNPVSSVEAQVSNATFTDYLFY